MSCPYCDEGIPHFGAKLHIEPSQATGWRFVPCQKQADCYIAAPPDRPAFKGEMMPDIPFSPKGVDLLTTTWGRVIGSVVLAALAFLAIIYLAQQ